MYVTGNLQKVLLAGTILTGVDSNIYIVTQDTKLESEHTIIPVATASLNAYGEHQIQNPLPATSIRIINSEPVATEPVNTMGILGSISYENNSANLWVEGQHIATMPNELGSLVSFSEETNTLNVPSQATLITNATTKSVNPFASLGFMGLLFLMLG